MKTTSRIRFGNDIAVSWQIDDYKDAGHAFPDTEHMSLYMTCGGFRHQITDFTVNGNALSWVFGGKSQKRLGTYKVILIEEDDIGGSMCIDVANAFTLVSESELSVRTGVGAQKVFIHSVLCDELTDIEVEDAKTDVGNDGTD